MMRWVLVKRVVMCCTMVLGATFTAHAGGFGPMGMMNPMGWFNGDDDRRDGRYYPPPPAYGYPAQPPGYAPYPPAYPAVVAPQPPAAPAVPAAIKTTTPQATVAMPEAKEPVAEQKIVTKSPEKTKAAAPVDSDVSGVASVPGEGKGEKPAAVVSKVHRTYDPAAPVFRPLDKE